MHKIERIKVTGFWDAYDFDVPLNPDVTFFIGVNGTGKTTFINLVAAVLFGDFPTLERIPFSSIEITLAPTTGNKKPSILVSKRKVRSRPFEGIQYKVRESQAGEEKSFSLDELSEQLILRGDEPSFARAADYYYAARHQRRQPRGLAETIQTLVQVSWLSIHRASGQQRSDDKSYESTVDRKLEQQSNDLVKYFSSLSKQKDEEIRKFQEFIFLSLLDETTSSEVFDPKSKERLSLQRDALEEIFRELHVPKDEFGSRIEHYFGHSEQALSKVKGKDNVTSYTTEELSNLLGLVRLNNVIERWQVLQAQLAEIFAQRDRFLEIINRLYQNKDVKISESNEILFHSKQGKPLNSRMLSSGEKQLLILLAEALLQRGRQYIFIADEPELSLHVKWQEKLISSLKVLNGSAQILVATHSPDIIGRLSKNVVDMETLLK